MMTVQEMCGVAMSLKEKDGHCVMNEKYRGNLNLIKSVIEVRIKFLYCMPSRPKFISLSFNSVIHIFP